MDKVVKICLAHSYFDILKKLGNHLDSYEMRTPYILTCAATLEYLLNDLIAAFAIHYYQDDDATEIAASLYTLSFRGKLVTIPALVTAGRLVVNRQSATFVTLCELIKARNMLVHNKPEFGSLNCKGNEEEFEMEFPVKMIKNHPFVLSDAQCKRYRLALLEFTRQVHDGDPAKDFDPDRLHPCDLLKISYT